MARPKIGIGGKGFLSLREGNVGKRLRGIKPKLYDHK
jgi:hypothetical protein